MLAAAVKLVELGVVVMQALLAQRILGAVVAWGLAAQTMLARLAAQA
jgi:hypothetical protein